jgi:hypothetical protein
MAEVENIADRACKIYVQNVREGLWTQGMPVPTCSLLLATDSSVYIVVEFLDFFTAMFANYAYGLADNFGASFANTPYEGAVILKSPWNLKDGGVTRFLSSYDLRTLEFCWEELRSGVRDPDQVSVLTLANSSKGQTDRDSPTPLSSLGAISNLSAAGDGRELLRLTNGSEWYLDPVAGGKCVPQLANQVGIDQIAPIKIKPALMINFRTRCRVQATFAGAWRNWPGIKSRCKGCKDARDRLVAEL